MIKINSSKKKKYLINLAKISAGLISVPLIPILSFAKLFGIKFIRLRSSRIGHLAGNTELFLRKMKLGIISSEIKIIGIATTKPCNEQLFKMFKRKIDIIQIHHSKYLKTLVHILSRYSILNKLNLFDEAPWEIKSYHQLSNCKPCLKFTEEEEIQGRELLDKIGIKDKVFICFHARDSSYLDSQWEKGDSYHNYRNCSIDNYLPAAEYFAKQGGFALRIGSVVKKKVQSENQALIDYANEYRSDFGDIYLSAKCKFFLGSTAGLFIIPTIFNIPVAHANLASIYYPPYKKEDLFIPMKILDKKNAKYLKFSEIIRRGIMFYALSEDYAK